MICIVLDLIDNLKLSIAEKSSFYYAGIPKDVPNKPSREDYDKYLMALKEVLNQLNEKQTKILAEYLINLMMDNDHILRVILLYGLSEI